MPLEPEPPKSDAVQQARAKAQRLAGAFEAVFGQPRKRSAAQDLVLSHFEVCAGDDSNSYRFNEARDGISLIAAGIHRDGAKSILRVIERQLSIAANVRVAKPDKPKTTR